MTAYSALVAVAQTPVPIPAEDLVDALGPWHAAVSAGPDGSREVIVSGDYADVRRAADGLVGAVLGAFGEGVDVLEVRVVPDAEHGRLEVTGGPTCAGCSAPARVLADGSGRRCETCGSDPVVAASTPG